MSVSGYPSVAPKHKSTHVSGGSDAFASTDLLEAQVKRILESGGQAMLLGAVADGQLLQRSGTNLLGVSGGTQGLLTTIEPINTQRVLGGFAYERSTATNIVVTSDKAYWVYIGRVIAAVTPKYVELILLATGTVSQTAEVGLFSTPAAPSKAGQTLTKLVSTGTVDSLLAGAVKIVRNTNAFATSIAAGTHLWAGIRTAMGGTQPTFSALYHSWDEGAILTTATAGALTNAGPWTGALPNAGSSVEAPEMRVTLD